MKLPFELRHIRLSHMLDNKCMETVYFDFDNESIGEMLNEQFWQFASRNLGSLGTEGAH